MHARIKLSAVISMLMIASVEAASAINGAFMIEQNGSIQDWTSVGHWMMKVGKGDAGGIAITVTKAAAKFNEIGFQSVKVPLSKGSYKFTVIVGGDDGARIFIGARTSLPSPNDVPGRDIWETLRGKEKTVTAIFTIAEDTATRIIIGIGLGENVDKTITIRELSLEPTSEKVSIEQKRIGAGTEYDGIILPKESELVDTNTLSTAVVVNENSIIRPVTPHLFGYNHDGPSSTRVFFKDNAIHGEFVEQVKGKNIPMPLNRIQVFGYFETTRWKKCLGPFEDRQVAQWYGWDKGSKKPYGPVEAVDLCQRFDPKAQFTWVVNPWDDPPDSADLVEFLTGSGEKPRNSENWAKKRIELGLPKPVPIVLYEIGNEVEWSNPPKRMSVTEYIERGKKHIDAIRSVDPKAKIAMHAATAPWGYQQRFKEDWRDWHKAILKELGHEIEYISIHPYYSGLPVSYIEEFLDTLRDDIAASKGAGRVSIFISEHATWPKDISKNDTWYAVNTLTSMLSVSHFLSRMLQRPEVTAATYHCFTHGGGLWGLIDIGKETQNRFTTAAADLFSMFRDNLGSVVVKTETSGDKIPMPGTGEKTWFVATAMTTKDGLSMFLVNREPSASRAIDLTFSGQYNLVKETVFTATSMRSHNTEFITNNFVTVKQTSVNDFKSYLMPPKSAVFLTLKRK
ncbi:MAG: hypothetical protein AABZ39_04000 [Spirochaetota bacterium]